MKRFVAAMAAGLLLANGLAQDEGQNTGMDGATATPTWNFEQVDSDGDGFLSMGEFGEALFEMLKPDEAEGLNQEQFETAVEQLGVADEEISFQAADVNQDGIVTDDQEFIPVVAGALFEEWTEEGASTMSAVDFNRGLFRIVDANGDETISADEFNDYAEWFGTDYQAVAGGGGGQDIRPDTFLDDLARGEESGTEGPPEVETENEDEDTQ